MSFEKLFMCTGMSMTAIAIMIKVTPATIGCFAFTTTLFFIYILFLKGD